MQEKVVVVTACSDRPPKICESLLRCHDIERCLLLAQVEPGCLETWGDLVNAGFKCVTNAGHLGINRNAQAVLMRARKEKADRVIFVSDWCELPEDALTRLTSGDAYVVSLAKPGFADSVAPLAWAVTSERLTDILAHWCTKRRDDYAWCVRRRMLEAGGFEALVY